MKRTNWASDLDHPGVRNYLVLCFLTLAVLLLVLVQRGLGAWSLFPVGVGLAALLLRWRLAPLMLLVTLAGVLFAQVPMRLLVRGAWVAGRPSALSDLLLCAAVLGFVAGHYRLQTLLLFAYPRDPRLVGRQADAARRARGKKAGPAAGRSSAEHRRPPALVGPQELALLAFSLLTLAGLAQVCFLVLVPPLGGPRLVDPGMGSEWFLMGLVGFGELLIDLTLRGGRLIWVLGGGLLVVATLLGMLRWRSLRVEEASLYLLDTAWLETCGEQRRIDRWRAWANKRKAKGEKPR